ncbi:hypothetical protein HZB89_00285 [archaeon]|nr:hypothetical protein [archaeon]
MSSLTIILGLIALALMLGLFFLWLAGEKKKPSLEQSPKEKQAGKRFAAANNQVDSPDSLSIKASLTALDIKLDLLNERVHALEQKLK